MENVLEKQKEHFARGVTLPVQARRATLRALKAALIEESDALLAALSDDLGKPPLESLTAELGVLVQEIGRSEKALGRIGRRQRVRTPIMLKPGRSTVSREPYGSVLVIGPWNYPLQLSMFPAIGALACGNTAVVKPSEFTPRTADELERVITERFDPGLLCVITGDATVAAELASKPFDYLFFTGSTAVGRQVYQAAARNLVPVTLELGGKNPAVVAEDANVAVAAKRIAYGKFFNAGQTCIAPDTVYVHRSVKDPLVTELGKAIRSFYGLEPRESGSYGRIVNHRHVERLTQLLAGAHVVEGGQVDSGARYLAPTIVDGIEPDSELAMDEVFGPILPVVSYSSNAELDTLLSAVPTPLATYVFTARPAFARDLVRRHPSGALVINDAFRHVMNPNLPFGGVGTSGLGTYRGKEQWLTFSRPMPQLERPTGRDIGLLYPPYRESATKWIQKLLVG